jgi:hypothetical protein
MSTTDEKIAGLYESPAARERAVETALTTHQQDLAVAGFDENQRAALRNDYLIAARDELLDPAMAEELATAHIKRTLAHERGADTERPLAAHDARQAAFARFGVQRGERLLKAAAAAIDANPTVKRLVNESRRGNDPGFVVKLLERLERQQIRAAWGRG